MRGEAFLRWLASPRSPVGVKEGFGMVLWGDGVSFSARKDWFLSKGVAGLDAQQILVGCLIHRERDAGRQK